MRSHPSTSNLLEHESLSVAVTESTSVMDAASCDGCGWESLRQHREVQSRPPSRVVGQTSALPVQSRVSCPDSVLRQYCMTSHCNDGSSASVSSATGAYGPMTGATSATGPTFIRIAATDAWPSHQHLNTRITLRQCTTAAHIVMRGHPTTTCAGKRKLVCGLVCSSSQGGSDSSGGGPC